MEARVTKVASIARTRRCSGEGTGILGGTAGHVQLSGSYDASRRKRHVRPPLTRL
jgi:hypothetical protein